MATIADLAVLVRSKNAGPFWLTLDIMFDNEAVGCATAISSTGPRWRACSAANRAR
jgi:hypothetical protein